MAEERFVQVQLLAAKPNPLFTEEQLQLVLFLRYSHAVPCAACGKRAKHHWTMRVSFSTVAMDTFVAQPSAAVHLPLTPVCRVHPLAPAALPAAKGRARAAH